MEIGEKGGVCDLRRKQQRNGYGWDEAEDTVHVFLETDAALTIRLLDTDCVMKCD